MTKTYTIKGKTDGFGAQYQSIMSGIVYCKFKNYNYIHTPLKSIEHNQNPKLLNKFIGIPISSSQNSKINIMKEFEPTVHWSATPSKYYTEEAIQILKNYYYSTPKPNIENIDIAIHIRRGDVNSSCKGRYTPNSYYNEIIKFLNKKYPEYSITIFSEGIRDDFDDFVGKNLIFKLNLNIEETFHSLVSAKILVTAKSSFSYSAAILNSNTIYYIDFWHKPLKHWINILYYVPDSYMNYFYYKIMGGHKKKVIVSLLVPIVFTIAWKNIDKIL